MTVGPESQRGRPPWPRRRAGAPALLPAARTSSKGRATLALRAVDQASQVRAPALSCSLHLSRISRSQFLPRFGCLQQVAPALKLSGLRRQSLFVPDLVGSCRSALWTGRAASRTGLWFVLAVGWAARLQKVVPGFVTGRQGSQPQETPSPGLVSCSRTRSWDRWQRKAGTRRDDSLEPSPWETCLPGGSGVRQGQNDGRAPLRRPRGWARCPRAANDTGSRSGE